MSNRVSRPFHEVKLSNSDQVLDFVLSQWEGRWRERQVLEQQWVENIAFYLGHQWSEYHPRLRRMVERARPAARVRLVVNRLLPMIVRKVASVIRGKPTWRAKPATNDYEDVAVSRLATKVLQGYWESILDMDRLLIELALWAETTGTVYIKTAWDPFAGPSLSAPRDSLQGGDASVEDLIRVFGEGKPGREVQARAGEACVEVRSPFEIATDKGAKTFEDAVWVHDTKAVPVTWLEARFPGEKFEADADESLTLSRYHVDRVSRLSETPGSIYGSPEGNDRDRTVLHQLWTCPLREYPDGFFAMIANDRVIKMGPSPYRFADPLKGPPYDAITAIPVPGRQHGTCSLRHAMSPQSSLNSALSHFEEMRRSIARPKWFTVIGSGVNKAQLSGERSGEIIEHQHGMRPEQSSPPPMPEWMMRLPAEARANIDDIASQHAATQGQQPGSVRSGSGIETLVETDAAGNIVTLQGFQTGLKRVGSRLLSILSRNVSEDRILTLGGEEFSVETVLFKGNSLIGRNAGVPGANYNNVMVEMTSSGPLTSTGQMNQVARLVETGILNPAQDRERIFKMLDLGYAEPHLDENRAERANVARENIAMSQGEMVNIEPFDNDVFHIVAHRRFQKNPEYRSLPPYQRQIFEQHIALHSGRYQAQQQAMLAAQMQQQGMPAGAPAQGGESNPQLEQAAVDNLRGLTHG